MLLETPPGDLPNDLLGAALLNNLLGAALLNDLLGAALLNDLLGAALLTDPPWKPPPCPLSLRAMVSEVSADSKQQPSAMRVLTGVFMLFSCWFEVSSG